MANYTGKFSVACLAVLALSLPAMAQITGGAFPVEINTEQNPFRNLSAAALAARSPGNMVTAGLARRQAALNATRGIIEITDPLLGPDPKATFLSEAVDILFEQLNSTLLYLGNILLERAGFPPLELSDLLLPSAGDLGDNDGDADNVTTPVRGQK